MRRTLPLFLTRAVTLLVTGMLMFAVFASHAHASRFPHRTGLTAAVVN